MGIITGMGYQNGHCAVDLGALFGIKRTSVLYK